MFKCIEYFFLPWSLKIFYGMLTDLYHPFGSRRKIYMVFGWLCVLALLAYMAFSPSGQMNVSTWMALSMLLQVFVMLSDVPADGMSVEYGKLEDLTRRGSILATGQCIRFFFCFLAGVIQSFLLNGPETNGDECPVSTYSCWSWGFSVNQYYMLILIIIAILFVPICLLKEIPEETIEKIKRRNTLRRRESHLRRSNQNIHSNTDRTPNSENRNRLIENK